MTRRRLGSCCALVLTIAASPASQADAAQPRARPRPGDPVVVPLAFVAGAGAFEASGDFALGVFDTQRGWEAASLRVPTAAGPRHALYSVPREAALFPVEPPEELPVSYKVHKSLSSRLIFRRWIETDSEGPIRSCRDRYVGPCPASRLTKYPWTWFSGL